MIKKFELKDFPCLDSLHDCGTSCVDLVENKLIFLFNKEGLSDTLMPNGVEQFPYASLKVTYVLNKGFIAQDFGSVRHINQRKFLRKRAIEFWTLKKLIDYLKTHESNLIIYGQYFDQLSCVIITELTNKIGWQAGNEFDLELLVDEIIYEWN